MSSNSNFQIVTAEATTKPTAYIFFAGNLIPHSVAARVSQWSAGGIVLPEVATLRHVEGYVRRCEITEMRQHMEAVAAMNVHPDARNNYVRTFSIQGSDVAIEVGNRGYDSHLLFSPVYPHQELPRLVGKGIGLVEMPVKSLTEAAMAQKFLFPQWEQYLSGEMQLPVKIKELRSYFISRRAAAGGNAALEAIANAAILSCDQFEAAGRDEIARQTEEYVAAEKKGVGWSYGLDAELYFEQLDVQRRDALVQQQSDKIDRLEEVLLRHAQALTAAMAGSNTKQPAQPPAALVEEEVSATAPRKPSAKQSNDKERGI